MSVKGGAVDLGLRGMKAVLCGASKGLGRATAEALASEGCDIAICARDRTALDVAVSAIASKGVNAIGETVDVANGQALQDWIVGAAEELGGCDIFISFTSGGGGPATEETWKANFELDLLANWRGVSAVMPYLKRSNAGSIVAISTTAAFEEFFGPQPYNAMKAALINYAAALSQQLAPYGIRVNTVSPGPILIEGGSWEKIKDNNRDLFDQIVSRIPTGRLGSADEVARAIAFIASPACPFLVGANVVIDGAFTKRVQY